MTCYFFRGFICCFCFLFNIFVQIFLLNILYDWMSCNVDFTSYKHLIIPRFFLFEHLKTRKSFNFLSYVCKSLQQARIGYVFFHFLRMPCNLKKLIKISDFNFEQNYRIKSVKNWIIPNFLYYTLRDLGFKARIVGHKYYLKT